MHIVDWLKPVHLDKKVDRSDLLNDQPQIFDSMWDFGLGKPEISLHQHISGKCGQTLWSDSLFV